MTITEYDYKNFDSSELKQKYTYIQLSTNVDCEKFKHLSSSSLLLGIIISVHPLSKTSNTHSKYRVIYMLVLLEGCYLKWKVHYWKFFTGKCRTSYFSTVEFCSHLIVAFNFKVNAKMRSQPI